MSKYYQIKLGGIPKVNELSQEKKDYWVRLQIKNTYEEYHDQGTFRFGCESVYDLLIEKEIIPKSWTIEKWLKRAEKRLAKEKAGRSWAEKLKSETSSHSDKVRAWAKRLILGKYFDYMKEKEIDIDEFILKVVPNVQDGR
jgi:hypothetical protein